MIHDGNKGSSVDISFLKTGTSHQNLSLPRSQAVQSSEAGKNSIEMEGRGFSDLYRNTSEELFMKALMEGSVGIPVPTMEMMGFKNLSQNFRADSEELFKSWLTNGENQGYNSVSIAHRTRQASQRMPTELASLGNQKVQNDGVILQKRSNGNPTPQNTSLVEESLNDVNKHSVRSTTERGIPASNLYLAKAWFNSSQPMTRSRSSELRNRYAALQNSQTAFGMEAMHNVSGHGHNNLKQEFVNPNGFTYTSMSEIPNHFTSLVSPSNFNTPQMGSVDKVSSVVSMLKGTLDRKKLTNQTENEAVEYSSLGYYGSQEGMGTPSLNQGQESHTYEAQGSFQGLSTVQANDPGVRKTVEGSIDIDLEEFVAPTNPIQMSTVSREPSQSESSAAAPVVSTGFDACDGPSNSGQTQSNCESSRQQVGNGKNSVNGTRAKDIRERIYDNLKEDRQKKGGLVRYGSVTSAGSVDRGDPTKKRRVERSRKMAEAKERVFTPAIPSDMQSILKRCENLEKEVRSLKLNLGFMNRKDSEQTKQIEELQKQNEELTDDKERLLEEIERIIISETSKM